MGFTQALFFLRGGGMIELIGPTPNGGQASENFLKTVQSQGEGFYLLSLDGTAGIVDALHERGIRTRETDLQHSDIHKSATLTPKTLFQLNPVLMGAEGEVVLKKKSSSKMWDA